MSQRATKLHNGMCAERRLRSAWASTQSDQSSHEESLGPKRLIERTAKTLIRADAQSDLSLNGRTCHFVGFVECWLKWYEKDNEPQRDKTYLLAYVPNED